MSWVITIDGPAASGKSTISRELAKRLQCPWVSTGAFYRGLAYVAFRKNINLNDVHSLVKLAKSADWHVAMTTERTKVFLGTEDVTDQISHEDVGGYASQISSHSALREALLQVQRNCLKPNSGLVAEGRDCGTVVFPNAEIKIYLTASSQNRAARRAQEKGAAEDEILKSQVVRDKQDSVRKTAPLQIPENAWVLDTTGMELPESLALVETHVRKKLGL